MHKKITRLKGIVRVIIVLTISVFFSTAAICAAANGILQVTIEKSAQNPLVGVPVYLFNESGAYLGQNQTTGSDGKVEFNLFEGTYKIRVDYLGYQFWSPVYTITGNLSETFTIAHQDVTLTVQGDYPSIEPISNIPVYLFNEAGSYLGQNQTTDTNGQVVFNLPEQSYKVRADYLGQQFWSDPFTWQDTTVTLPMADAEITVTSAGAPVEGVNVYVFTASGSYLSLNNATDADGKVTFHFAAGDYKFRADYQGSQYWSNPTTLTAGQINPVSILAGGGGFTFTVLKGPGVPLIGVNCYVFNEAGSYLNMSDATDEVGQISFNLADGTYKIRVDYLGYQFWSPVYSVTGNLSEAFTIVHQDVTITVQGDYPGPEPISNIPFYLFTESGAYVSHNQTTDSSGQVVFNLPEQSYKMRADFLGQQFWSDPLTWQDTLVTVPMAYAEIAVTSAGAPVEGVNVYVFTASGAYLSLNNATDADGKVTFHLAAGDYKFRADYQGSQYWSNPTTLTAGQINPVSILAGGGGFTFTVLKGPGVPLTGVNCYVFSEAGSYLNMSDATDTSGQISFNLADGAYNIRVDYLGYQFWSPVYTVSGNLSETFTIAHQDVTITVQGDYPGPEPISNIPLYLFTESGAYVSQNQSTDASGQMVFNLPEQSYKVRVDYMGQQFWSDPFTWQDTTVTVPMADAEITVTSAGAPVQGVNVYVFTASGSYLSLNGVTDAAGKVAFRVPAGDYKFRADYQGSQYWSPVISIQAGVVNNVDVDISPVTVNISADPENIQPGELSTLTWNSTGAESCVIEPDIGVVNVSGSIQVSPSATTTYTITATGPGGTATDSDTVTVNDTLPPLVSISANPAGITQGQSSTLTWTSTNAQSAFIDNGVGSVPVNGSTTVYPEHTTTYTITVTGPTGSNSAQAKIQVTGNPAPLPEGSFGEQYEDLIPADSTVEEYDAKRFSLITGLVYSIDDSPVSNVSVTLHGHPEYGTVSTDAEGRFSIPVEGGTTLILAYNKSGFISAHRKVYVPWNDIAIAEAIQMVAEDPVATTVTFDGNPDTVVTHQSTQVTDEFGSRSATLVFTGDNHAYLVDENGNDVHELTTITTRATEYTTPESMPAKLPPTSAYTYCAELSVDGAQRVRFEKPVITWVDNFLGFDVGEIVPVGYYDRDRGVWIPSDNGVVVKLLDTDSDGIVDALDANGDDNADDLDEDGSYLDEVEGLEDPSAYSPGDTYWRFSVTHFTPHDCNWPYGPPLDVIYPNPNGEPDADQQQPKVKTCPTYNNSFVEDRSRIFHEDIPIPGTDITLHYASNRAEEYQTKITVPASGDTVPDSLKEIVVILNVAGRNFKQTLAPLPNQNAEFVWDGLDRMGRQMKGTVTAYVMVGFVYNYVYYGASPDFWRSWGNVGKYATVIPLREDLTTWKPTYLLIPQESRGKGLVADGWSISSHHYLNPLDISALHKGDGTITKNIDSSFKYNYMDIVSLVEAVAGNGTSGYSGDDGQAIAAQLNNPSGITIDEEGNLYVADSYNHSIRKVDVNGIITTVTGNGTPGYSGDGGPASQAQLRFPSEVIVDVAGNLYIVDAENYCIRKVDVNGIITTVVGNGTSDYSGDGLPANEASLVGPEDVVIDVHGNLYIIDYSGEILFGGIRKVSTDGIIETISPLPFPASSLAVDTTGNFYVSMNHTVFKGDISGAITIVAGNGTPGYIGDDGPATEAQLNNPTGITVDPMGNLYIVDRGNDRVRKVNPSGIITTVAGQGAYGYNSQGDPVDQIQFSQPSDVAINDSGKLYAVYTSNHSVAKIGPLVPYVFVKSIGGKVFTELNGQGHVMSEDGRHLKTINLDTGAILYEFGYDQNNNLISITDQFGNQTTINRDVNGVPTLILSPDGLMTQLTIDATNHLTRITYPDGSFYSFEFTPDGLMTAKIEPEGNRFDHVFDAAGKLTDASDEEGGHWQFKRTAYANGDIISEVLTAEGNLTSYLDHTDSTGAYTSTITDSTGAETMYSQSRLTVNKTLPCGMDLEFKYDIDPEYKFKYVKEMTETTPSSLEKITIKDKTYQDTDADDIPDLITETVTINDKTTTFMNNIPQSRKTITSPEARTVTMLYDPSTLLTESISIPGLFDTSYGYDARGRLTSVDTNTRGTDFTYNAQGFLESVTDPENHTTTYSYDAVGRVTGINRPDTTSIGFIYDNNGNMTVLTNPSTINHGFGYNKVNLNSSYQMPLSGSYSYLYDKDRRLKQTNFPTGNQINNIYANGRLEQIQTPEGNIDFTYLCGTKVESITKGAESITYSYDGKLVTSETFSGMLNQALGYTYNDDFNLTSLTYAGVTESFTYDNDDLLTGSGSFAISRNVGNGLPETVAGGSLSLSRTFNGYGEVEAQDYSIGGQNLTSWNLVRDDNGIITNKSETVGGTSSDYIYTYDAMGRLLTVTKDSALVEEYQYDVNGTRIYEMNSLRGIAGRSFSYDYEDHLLTAGSVIYSYNLDGFLAAKTGGSDVTTYDYSSRGELLNVTLPDGTMIEYVHDPLGRRIAKKIDGLIVEKYLWQGLTRLLAVYDGSDNLIMRFEYADGRMPVAMNKGGSTYYLTYDQVGSLRVVADASGNVVKKVGYDSFGNIISDSDPAFEVPFGFAGGLHDRDTGLVRFGYRDYDPDVGRWTAKDPILFAGGDTDLYGYVLNDPVNWVDPIGLRIPGAGKAIGWGIKRISKWVGGKIGEKIGEWADFFNTEIKNPPEQQDMEKDTDEDGINDYWDNDDDNNGIPDDEDNQDNNVNESPCG